MKPSCRIAFTLSALLIASLQVKAASYTKLDNTNNLRNSGAWTPGGVPGAADTVVFTNTMTSITSSSMGTSGTFGQILFVNPANSYTIAGSILTLAGVGGVGIDMSSATQNLSITSALALSGNQAWIIGSGRTLTIGNTFTQNGFALSLEGAGTLIKNNTSALTLTAGANAYTGGITLGGGVTTVGTGALGTTGAITFTSGTFQYGTGNTGDISSRISNSTSAMVIDTNGNNVVLASSIGSTNTGGLTKVGSGTLTLAAANSYTGTTTLNSSNGTAAVIIGDKAAFGSGQVVLNGGAGSISASTNLTGANRVMNNITLVNNLTNSTSASSLEYGGNIDLNAAAKSITNNSASSNTIFSGVIGNDNGAGLTLVSTGTITLSGLNTFTGILEFRGARPLQVSQLGNIGSAGNVGTAGVLRFGAASATAANLRYTGVGETTNRNLEFNTSTGALSIEHAGTGLLAFTGSTTTTASGTKTLTLIASNSGTGSLAGSLADNGGALSVAKSGTGTWILAGNNTYTGATSVTAGTLILNGSNTSAVTVGSGAILGGSGSTSGAVTIASGGILAPGNSPGILSTGDLSLAGSLSAQLGKATPGGQPIAGTDYDQVNVTGSVTLTGGDLSLSILSGIQTDDLYFIILNDSNDAITGIFATLNNVATDLSQGAIFNAGSQYFQISYTANSAGGTFTGGNDVALLAVPEPSTWALLGLGFGALVWRSGFRRRKL